MQCKGMSKGAEGSVVSGMWLTLLPPARDHQPQADHLLELYETKWKRSVDPLYGEFMY